MLDDIRNKVSAKFCPRFGQCAVEKGYVSADQLKSGLSEQIDDELAGEERRLLGRIFFDKGWMSSEQIETALNIALKRMREEEEDKD